MMTDKTMTLLGWLNAPRDPDGAVQKSINRIGVEKLFSGIMHDSLCESRRSTGNDLFKLSYTPDGEAYLDWTLRTEKEWYVWVTNLAIRGVASDILKSQRDE